MFAYIVRRLALMLVTLFGISVIIFVLLRIVPGNIVDILFDAAGYRRSRRQGQSGTRSRARPADRRAVSALDRRPAARRPRLFLCLREAGAGRDPAANSDHGAAGRPGAAVLRLDRHSARRHQRGAPGHPAGLCPAHRQPQRPVAAVVLARPVDPDGVGVAVRDHADLQSQSQDLDRGDRDLLRSGDGGGLPQLRADHAHHALLDAGNPAPGLHPHRARQGRLRMPRSITAMR